MSCEGPLICVRSLGKRHGSGERFVEALTDVSFDLGEGESLAITGPSGSGKSTLLHILGCLDQPSEGSYRLGGVEIASLADGDLSRMRGEKLGFVFQRFHLIPYLTVEENVGLPILYRLQPTNDASEMVDKALARVGLSHRKRHRPRELSGGEAQRVAIARALIMRPLLLIADEPTGSLDSGTGRQIIDLFQEFSGQGVTVIMATHDGEVAASCMRRLCIRDGRLA